MSFSLRHSNTGLVSSRASYTSLREGAPLAVAGHSSSDSTTIKMAYGVVFYIDQLRTLSFPMGWLKLDSALLLDQYRLKLGRWKLVVTVISINAYPFLAFSDLTCHLEDTGIGIFWLHCAAW